MNKGMSIEAALSELQKPLNGPHAKSWSFGPAVRTLIAALEQAKAEAKEFRHLLRNEQALLESADKRIDELENDEVRQRLANAEHQLYMAELAKHNLRTSRRAQFRKRLAAERRVAELEASKISVKLPDEFSRIGENLRTQDNRVTSDPMFCVFQKREIVTDEDYEHDRIVWIDEDGNEATVHQRRRLELLHENSREAPEKWRRIAVKEIIDFVTCCFTEQGCKDYLACNGHNLRLPFIYVKSGFRNTEYQTLRNWLMRSGTVEGSDSNDQ